MTNQIPLSAVPSFGSADHCNGTAPKAILMEITPETASLWLAESNTNNRNISQSSVKAYARDMTDGRWVISNDNIVFSKDGTLLNGQHRLCAIKKSGVTIKAFVMFGASPEWQDIMDSGVKRPASFALQLEGMKNTNRLSAAARIALARSQGMPIVGGNFNNSEVQTFVRVNRDMADAIELVGKGALRAIPCLPRVTDYCCWLFYRIDPAAAHSFFASLASGANLAQDNPILVLRNRLAGEYGRSRRITVEEQISLVVRAWNFWRQGKTILRIQSISQNGTIAIPDPI